MPIPSQQEYEQRELQMAHKQIKDVERAPLADRKEAAAEFLEAMQDSPDTVGERVGWLLAGNYGFGAMLIAKNVLHHKRMNREAALTHLVATFEWMAPQRMAAQEWKKLTHAQQDALDVAVREAIADAEASEREEAEYEARKSLNEPRFEPVGLRALETKPSLIGPVGHQGLIHLGNLVFIDKDPVEGGENIYPFVEWQNLHRADYGFAKTDGGPTGKWIDSTTVNQAYFDEPRASAWGETDAIHDAGSKYAFEEEPNIEFTSKEYYDEFLVASGQDVEDGNWEGPGIYDGRDKPPTRSSSAEEYEVADLAFWSSDTLEFMFQGEGEELDAVIAKLQADNED